jgi:cell cycle serine/threonine-protein kinase CDC5/MSD2
MAQSLAAPSPRADPEQVKSIQRLVDKLKYCKEVLVSIRKASATGSVVQESEAMGSALIAGGGGNGHD